MLAFRWRSGFGLALALFALAMFPGCRSVPPPNEQLAVTRSAVDDAIEAGAAEHAAPELASARQKFDRARSLNARQEYQQARRLAEQAEVDARLAATKARAVRARRELANAEENLRTQSQRSAPSPGPTR